MRPVLVTLLIAATAAPAFAAAGRKLALTPASADTPAVFTTRDSFPAVAPDGTVAELFFDEQDFTGAPFTTLVVWSSTGERLASFSLGGVDGPSGRSARQIVAAANKLLATRTWTHVPSATSCGDADAAADDAGHDLCFAGNVHIHIDDAGALTLQVGKAAPQPLAATFPAPGSASAEVGGGTCGGVVGLERGFGSLAGGLVIVVPRVNLGGDSCFGSPSEQLAIAVRVRP